jgi:hypothetical protein
VGVGNPAEETYCYPNKANSMSVPNFVNCRDALAGSFFRFLRTLSDLAVLTLQTEIVTLRIT